MTEEKSGTEERSGRDRLLDTFVFLPAGIALTVAEEFPRLAAKGRERIENQVHLARMVGGFSVRVGRREMNKLMDTFFPTATRAGGVHRPQAGRPLAGEPFSAEPTPTAPAPAGPGSATLGPGRTRGDRPPASEPRVARPSTPAPEPRPAAAPPAAAASPSSSALSGSGLSSSGNGPAPVTELAIPAYDTMSASNVLERLGGLSPEELRQLQAYEQSHRHRRTVLNRIDQLLAGPTPSPGASGSSPSPRIPGSGRASGSSRPSGSSRSTGSSGSGGSSRASASSRASRSSSPSGSSRSSGRRSGG